MEAILTKLWMRILLKGKGTCMAQWLIEFLLFPFNFHILVIFFDNAFIVSWNLESY